MNLRKNENLFINSYSDTRLAILENSLDHFGESLRKIENHLISMEKKFESKFESLDKKFELRFSAFENRFWILFSWTSSGFVGITALIAHALHWI